MDHFSGDLLPTHRDSITEGPLMERYLQDKSRPPLFDTDNYGSRADTVFIPMCYPEHALTWSSQSHTSNGSVAISPPADSDIYYDGMQGPTTPEYSASSSSYDAKMVSSQWDGQHLQHAQFALAYLPRHDCINPSDIIPERYVTTPPPESNDGLMSLEYTHQRYTSADDSAIESIDPDLLPGGTQHGPPRLTTVTAPRTVRHDRPQPLSQIKAERNDSRAARSRRSGKTKRAKPARSRIASLRNPDRAVGGRATVQTNTENVLPETQEPDPCSICGDSFTDQTSLQRHVRSVHRRPFICVFHYAGCNSTFGAKNEWKRHVLSQHLGLFYWHCTLDHCSQANPLHAHGRSPAPGIPSYGSIFNRKDLYTQHVRRMHLGMDGSKKVSQVDEERLKAFQEEAKKKRCELPAYMECPAPGCRKQFHGGNAWDERMEHVACHLGLAASGKEDDVRFGGDRDLTLTNWAASPNVGVAVPLPGGGWQHRNPLKGNGGGGGVISPAWNNPPGMFEEDAEGEDCDPEV